MNVHQPRRDLAGHKEEREHAHEEKDAGGDHRRRMNHGADRRGAFHRVRQPDVQRELGALAHGAEEEQKSNDGDPREALRRRRGHAP